MLQLTRLDRQRETKGGAGGDVEEAREDEGARQGDGALEGEGDHQREEGAQVSQGARDLRERRVADGAEVVSGELGDVLEGHPGTGWARVGMSPEVRITRYAWIWSCDL